MNGMPLDLDNAHRGPKIYGKVKGFVRDNADPEGRGRLMVFCPQVMGPEDVEQNWLGWCEACLPWLGGFNTLNFGPPMTKQQNGGREVGVWIEFEDGNPDFPIWVGTFLPAPTNTDAFAQINLEAAAGTVGGNIISNAPAGSLIDDINPPKPLLDENEVRLVVPPGKDIVIMSEKGGTIIIGPSGVHITAPHVTINGRAMSADRAGNVWG